MENKDLAETKAKNPTGRMHGRIKNLALGTLTIATGLLGYMNLHQHNELNQQRSEMKDLQQSLASSEFQRDAWSNALDSIGESAAFNFLPVSMKDGKTAYLKFNINKPSEADLYTVEKGNDLAIEHYKADKNGNYVSTGMDVALENDVLYSGEEYRGVSLYRLNKGKFAYTDPKKRNEVASEKLATRHKLVEDYYEMTKRMDKERALAEEKRIAYEKAHPHQETAPDGHAGHAGGSTPHQPVTVFNYSTRSFSHF